MYFFAQRALWVVANFRKKSSFQEIENIDPAMFVFIALIIFFETGTKFFISWHSFSFPEKKFFLSGIKSFTCKNINYIMSMYV